MLGGGGGNPIIMDQVGAAASAQGSCRTRSKPKRAMASNGKSFKFSANDEGDLIQMLNDTTSELYRLFSHHNPNKSPQQCFLDLKYSPPQDLESQSLYEKVLKYAQLHRKLGKRIRREKPRVKEERSSSKVVVADEDPLSCKRKVEETFVTTKDTGVASSAFSQVQQEDGCMDDQRKNKKKKDKAKGTAVDHVHTEKLCMLQEKVKGNTDSCSNPLNCENMTDKKKRNEESEEPENSILKSYQRALTTANVDTGLRLALLDEDCNRMAGNGCGDGLGSCGLPSLMRPRKRSPAENRNCYVSRPMRANRIQHSLSSVSSIEVHKTNTTCSMSSTSISISTCEFVSGKDEVIW